VNEYQKLAGTSGQLAKILKLPGVDKFGKVVGYYDISKNSAKLLKDLYNGELLQLDNLQVAGDLVADVAGQFGPLGKAYNAGYAIGKFIDGKLGLSSKLADFIVGDRRVYSTRTFVQEYVRTHGTPAEQAAYRQWRQEFNAQRAGQPAIPFRPPDLPVLKKIDPAILRMAETNKDIPAAFYDLSLKNAWIPPFFRDAVLK
jgi:hypothetical protein